MNCCFFCRITYPFLSIYTYITNLWYFSSKHALFGKLSISTTPWLSRNNKTNRNLIFRTYVFCRGELWMKRSFIQNRRIHVCIIHNINKKTAKEARRYPNGVLSLFSSDEFVFWTQAPVHKLLFLSLKNKYDLFMKLTLQTYII